MPYLHVMMLIKWNNVGNDTKTDVRKFVALSSISMLKEYTQASLV